MASFTVYVHFTALCAARPDLSFFPSGTIACYESASLQSSSIIKAKAITAPQYVAVHD